MPSFNTILSGLQIISLVLIAGGTVVLGALIAPLLFKSFSKKEASKVMIKMFEQFDEWLKLSAAMLLASKLIQLIFINKFSFSVSEIIDEKTVKHLDMGSLLVFILILAVAAISFHLVFRVTPELKKLYDGSKDRQKKEFNELHKQSEMIHKLNFLVALITILSFA